MKIHQIDSSRKWTGHSMSLEDTSRCPPGWIISDSTPQQGDRWTRTGWHPTGQASPDDADRKARLEAAYHAIIANSLCNLQSQTAWLGAVALGSACNLPKILECRAWIDRLWAQYHVDKQSGADVPSFTEPPPPYSFIETMTPETP